MDLAETVVEIQRRDADPDGILTSEPEVIEASTADRKRSGSYFDDELTSPCGSTSPGRGDGDDSSGHPILRIQNASRTLIRKHGSALKTAARTVLFLGYAIYFAFAVRYSAEGATGLIVMTSLVTSVIIYEWVKKRFGTRIKDDLLAPIAEAWHRKWPTLKWFIYPAMVLSVLLYLTFDVVREIKQLQSLAGIVLFFTIPMITSKYPKRIKWRPVSWGMALQFVIGCLVLRWVHGYNAIRFLSTELNKFLGYSISGGAKVFGDPTFVLHPFAMIVVPLVVYLGCVMSILYYLGAIQWVAVKLGWLMSISLQTTAIESISLIVNIFLSVVDVVLMMRKYIPNLTDSEFHCFLVAAHSTIAGFAFGLFVLFGVNAQHLMTGSVMSAPAAVAFAKLNYPETEETRYKTDKDLQLDRGADINLIDAAVRGAWEAATSVGAILVQTIAFVSIIVFVDAGLSWFFARVGVQLNIATLLGYLFMPIAFLMGVDWEDTLTVGRLIGFKVVANEFLAYFDLGREIRKGTISDRSAAIATYAMCGFSSFGTLVIFAGVWQEVDPRRARMATAQIPRILMNANLSCFMTACIASLLYTDDVIVETDEEVKILGDMARWFLEFLPSYEELRQRLIDFAFPTTV